MPNIKIVIPSHRRSEIFETNIKNQIVCVHESEKEDYKGFETITHNENTLPKIRQFIYEKFGDVFMVDDDIVSVERLFEADEAKLTPTEIYNLIQENYYVAKQLKVSLFGFNNTMNPKHYKPQKPFVANGYINACAFGIMKDDNLYFTSKIMAADSHWINCLNAYYNRRSFQNCRYAFRQKSGSTFTRKGGQADRRTKESEKRDTLFLKMMFGGSIQLRKGQKDSKQLHKYQRKLNIRL